MALIIGLGRPTCLALAGPVDFDSGIPQRRDAASLEQSGLSQLQTNIVHVHVLMRLGILNWTAGHARANRRIAEKSVIAESDIVETGAPLSNVHSFAPPPRSP